MLRTTLILFFQGLLSLGVIQQPRKSISKNNIHPWEDCSSCLYCEVKKMKGQWQAGGHQWSHWSRCKGHQYSNISLVHLAVACPSWIFVPHPERSSYPWEVGCKYSCCLLWRWCRCLCFALLIQNSKILWVDQFWWSRCTFCTNARCFGALKGENCLQTISLLSFWKPLSPTWIPYGWFCSSIMIVATKPFVVSALVAFIGVAVRVLLGCFVLVPPILL